MVFCNETFHLSILMETTRHNPYFNRWFSAIDYVDLKNKGDCIVTILILIDGFLQWKTIGRNIICIYGHNPYFNRWFSAIYYIEALKMIDISHNPYFNRWFSAILLKKMLIHLRRLSQSLF